MIADMWIVFIASLFMWIGFGLYVDSQVGEIRTVIIQRIASFLMILASLSIVTFGV